MRRAVFLVSLLLCAAATPAFAQTALDAHVSAIPAATLLRLPASALVDPGAQAAGLALTAITRPLFFAWVFAQILALWYLWQSGRGAQLRDFLRRHSRNEHVLRFVFGAALAIVAALAALPVAFTLFRLAFAAQLTTQTVAGWFGDYVTTTALDALTVGILIAAILPMVERTRLWYVPAILLLFAFAVGTMFVEPVVVAPLFNQYEPLHDPALAARIHALSERAGVGDPPIYVTNLSKQSVVENAWVAGFGPTRRIVLGDTLVAVATADEATFIVAHELSHYVHGDVLKLTLVATGLLVLALTFAVLVGDRIRFRRDDDPVSRLALIGALAGCAALVLFPVYNGYQRGIEARADRFGLALSHDPAGGIRAFVRFADDGLQPVCPPEHVRLYFYDHPPIGTRIARLQGRPDPCP